MTLSTDKALSRTLQVDELEKFREIFRNNFYAFAKGLLGYDRMTKKIHKPICDLIQQEIEELEHRKDLLNRREPFPEGSKMGELLIELPRSWFKSTIGSVAAPLWIVVRNPNWRILIVQNTITNACKKLASIKDHILDNRLLQTIFPHMRRSAKGTWRADAATIERSKKSPEATFEVAGANTDIVSRHYDVAIEDDTVAPDLDDMTADALLPSKEDVEHAIGFHKLLNPIMDHPIASLMIVIGTRWYEEDLISFIKQQQKGYRIYSRACVEDEHGQPNWHEGQPVWPEMFSWEVLKNLRNSMGEYLFNTLYLNSPTTGDDQPFKPEYMEYYENVPYPNHLLIYTTVDLAGDAEQQVKLGDYNVVMTCGKCLKTGNHYVLEYFRKRCNPGETIDAIFDHVLKHHPLMVGVESVALQNHMLYHIRARMQKVKKWFRLEPVKYGKSSKIARIQGLEPVCRNHKLFIKPWMKELETELLVFPRGKNDDIIDALSMQLQYWNASQSEDEVALAKEQEPNPGTLDYVIKEVDRMRNQQRVGSVTDLLNKDIKNEKDLNSLLNSGFDRHRRRTHGMRDLGRYSGELFSRSGNPFNSAFSSRRGY